MSNAATTTAHHASRIAELTAGLDDYLFSFAGRGNLKVTTLDGQTIYSIANAHKLGHTPEAITAAMVAA